MYIGKKFCIDRGGEKLSLPVLPIKKMICDVHILGYG